MALIKCTECGKEISDIAKNCPSCGCPIANGQKYTPEMQTQDKINRATNIVNTGFNTIHYLYTFIPCVILVLFWTPFTISTFYSPNDPALFRAFCVLMEILFVYLLIRRIRFFFGHKK